MEGSTFAQCDVVLSEEDIVQPDIFFISKEREHIITEMNIQGAPDLVIEILSPFTAKLDKSLKLKLSNIKNKSIR
jgi:Uma2 family endonuclease